MLKAFPDMEIEKSGVYVFAWIEHEPTHFDVKWWDEEYKEPNHIADAGKMMGSTNKNDLGVDLISRADVLKLMQDNWHTHNGDWAMQESMDDIRALPPVTPQEPQSFKWCTDCKEYDQEKHCCHRWSKVIRDTVAEIRQEPVIDKLEAEIGKIYEREGNSVDCLNALDELKWFIGKCKAESEDNND